MNRPTLVAALVLVLGATTSCRRHVALLAPATSPGSLYECDAVEGGGDSVNQPKNCRPATTDVPAELNKRGTTFIVLPKECDGRFNRIVIHDADSNRPTVTAVCAPPEPAIITTTPK